MNLVFKGNNNTSFSLGTVSFNFLDNKNVFDNYQQDTAVDSIVILEVFSTDLNDLSKDIITAVESDSRLRSDIAEKLKEFSVWVKDSNGFKAFIL